MPPSRCSSGRGSTRAGFQRWRASSRQGNTRLSLPAPSRFLQHGLGVQLVTGSDIQGHGACSTACSCQGRTGSSTSRRAPSAGRRSGATISDAGLRSTVVSVYSAAVLPSFRGTQVPGLGIDRPVLLQVRRGHLRSARGRAAAPSSGRASTGALPREFAAVELPGPQVPGPSASGRSTSRPAGSRRSSTEPTGTSSSARTPSRIRPATCSGT